jgi:hypothetical protein
MSITNAEAQRRYVHRLDAQLRAERGNKCEEDDCEETFPLEWAHVKPTRMHGRGRGKKNRLVDVKKNPDCYKLLCRPCHRRRDEIGYGGAEDVMEQIPF